jgi:tricorn protease
MRTRWLRALALVCSLAAPAATPAGPLPQFLRRPDIQGDQVVFTSEGDLWLGSIRSGTAMRITSADGVEGPARFSPDGSRIAFTAQYDGGTDVYVMDAGGGMPRRLTWDPRGAVVQGWSPDGANVLFRSMRHHAFSRNRLWSVPAAGGSARLLPIPYAEFASMNADGRRIAYVPVSAEWHHWKRYRGGSADDVWLADTLAHTFRRLTTDPGVDTEPVWVGDAIYFVSERDGHANLCRLDPSSGAVAAATTYADYDVRYPGTDGKRVIFEHGDGLALFDPATGRAEDLSLALHSDRIHARERRVPATKDLFGVAIGPTGKRLLVSARGQILSAPVEHGDVRAIAALPASRCQYPAWSADGRQVAFVSDRSGEEQIWVVPSSGGAARQLTKDHRGQLGPLLWAPDGKTIATSDREMRILLVDTASGAITVVDQADRGGSYDLVHRSQRFSPDGGWLAYARLEPNWNWTVHLYDIAGRRSVPVTTAEMNSAAPAFDSSGKYLYFLSDRAFDPRNVSPNRYFGYDKFTKVSLVTLADDGKSPFLTPNDQEGAAADSATGESKDSKKKPAAAAAAGKKADATKGTAPPRTRVDVAGLRERIVDVPVPADRYERVEPVEGRLLLLTLEEPGSHEPFDVVRQLRAFDIKKKEVKVLVNRLSDFQVSADRKKILLQTEKSFTVIDAGADEVAEGKGKVETDAWALTADPAAEWRQIFHETWRIARDFFYDPAMHGVDWPSVRRKYEAMLPAAADRSDLNFILGEMVAELNCSHAYIGGGDLPSAPRVPMGFLGADLEPVPGPTTASRVTKLYPGDEFDLEARSPLLTPGIDVKPGEYILAVGGQPVRADQDIQALLAGAADRPTVLTVNSKPSLTGAREVLIRPMASERAARYYDWVASRREYVRANGGANLGYVHVPDMMERGLREFAKHYYPSLDRDGMIYDVRYNGGGYIDAMLLLQIASKPYSYFKPRYGASWTRQDWGPVGHGVALVNDESFSDAEEFCDAFQRLKLGPVIGVRSGGGEVGSGGGYPMLDGGTVFIPNYAEWVPGGTWVIEGTGVEPDIVIEEDPAALMAGRDPQLDRAIEYLKQRIAAQPVARPAPPPFPDKSRGGSSGGGQ